MKVAVLTLTRDRLPFTRHCFAALAENAGCDYDHFVWDNGSTDGTVDWLNQQQTAGAITEYWWSEQNRGISTALNSLLFSDIDISQYDVVVKIDNDCEIVTPDTLRDVCDLVHTYGLILSPEIHGLRQPPRSIGGPLSLGGQLVDEKHQIGGIFLAAPASLYADGFRYSEGNPKWGGDDVEVCAFWRAQGGQCGYVRGIHANHYLGTDAQYEADPEYHARKVAEMSA